jgi:beta-lactam-binding protein with PASTA domain
VNVRRRQEKEEKTGRTWTIPRKWLIIGGIALGAFLVGYGVTALAFTTGDAATDIALVPDVRALTLTDAARSMREADLTMVVGDSFPNADVPAGAVLAQTPLPGQEVGVGTEVSVIISTGQPRPIVPDVAAMPLAMALRSLQAAGFEVAVEEVPGEGSPGRVFDVMPAAGTAVPLPATVVIRVGTEPLFLRMPTVIGLTEDSARVTLEQVGLAVTEVRYESTSNQQPYQVLSQEPAPGDSIDPGSPVRIFVSLPEVDRGTLRQGPDQRVTEPVYAAGG